MTPFLIRFARREDVPLLLELTRELADYEQLSDQVTATTDMFEKSLFDDPPAAEALIAFHKDEPAGLAVYFSNFSTFLGRRGCYLEDLYVRTKFRGQGLGEILLRRVAAIAKERGCQRFEWAALNWNEPAIGFYRKLGAIPLSEWTVFRVTGEALDRLADPG